MYFGRHEGKIEAKNRIAFPAKIRELTGDKLLITNWFEKSLVIVPEAKAELLISDLRQQSDLIQEVRDFELFVFGGSEIVELDKQGRFIIPKHLMDYAELKKQVVFTGGRNYVRLWDRDILEAYYSLTSLRLGKIALTIREKLEQK